MARDMKSGRSQKGNLSKTDRRYGSSGKSGKSIKDAKHGGIRDDKTHIIQSNETGEFVEPHSSIAGRITSLAKEQRTSYGGGTPKVVGKVHIEPLEEAMQIIVTGRPAFQLTPLEKMQLAEEGISKNALESLKEKSGLDYDQLSQLLNVARTTLIGKKGDEKFNTDVSDKILGLADIYSYGYEVFEDRNRFNEWIFRPNKALRGQSPFDILHNSFGKEEVKNLIGRIDYGIYS